MRTIRFNWAGLVCGGGRTSLRGLWVSGCLALTALAGEPAAEPSPAAPKPAVVQATAPAAPAPDALLRDWGIQITALRPSANGNLIDFRYRVVDPEKASVFANTKVKPVLIDQESGTSLHVPSMPKVGPLRSTNPRLRAGKIYTALFANPGARVKGGHKVTVVFGDFRAENLTVKE